MVAVAVGDQNGRDTGPTKFGMKIQDLLGPRTVRLASIDHYHVVVRIADEVDLGTSGMHGPEGALVFLDVSAINMFSDAHRGTPDPRINTPAQSRQESVPENACGRANSPRVHVFDV